ncbi:MAG: 50S ribosomal protein L3 [Thermoplasmata archaeon]|nr:50S ribosomal protein L3 [Thermoplasmata archaeon]
MAQRRHPRAGSIAYSPRKRARSQLARVSSWPQVDGSPRLLGFAGYKAGMTHVIMIDYRSESTTSGQEIQIPVTVLEVPPLKVCGVRLYRSEHYGIKTIGEMWSDKLDEDLSRRLPIPGKNKDRKNAEAPGEDCDDVRIIAHTQPRKVTGIPSKTPEIMEIGIGGGTIAERVQFAKSILGKEVKISDFAKEGVFVDVVAVTKGKGFQGVIKRWTPKMNPHKNSKHRRMIANLGPKRPGYVRWTVPQAGQMGFHQRTEHNKLILKIGQNGEEVTPKGGFLHYGSVRNDYVLLHGSIPGINKRTIRLREPVRAMKRDIGKAPDITYISLESKQGA